MKSILITFSFILLTYILFSQNNKKEFNEAIRFLSFNNYLAATNPLSKIVLNEPDNANACYLLGKCLLNNVLREKEAVKYFEIAIKNVNKNYKPGTYKEKAAPVDAYLFLGIAYHRIYEFDKAIQMFDKYLQESNGMQAEEANRKNAELYKIWCSNGKKMMADSAEIKIYNLGEGINTQYDEHTPLINSDENMLVFTSRRPGSTGNLKTDDGKYFEDIYISYKKDGKWMSPKKIHDNINTEKHDATAALSSDGSELYIYRDDFGVGNLYVSYSENQDEWTIPEKLGSNINSNFNETSASITADKNTLYFVSDRKEGKGGLDIYVVKRLPNGRWAMAQNIGSPVNTEYDEEGVFIHPDGTSLFFSSNGKGSMGGYDLFYSELNDDGTWSEPVNLGYPINTTGDDVFYVLSTDGKRAYYSSIKENGFGGRDIYMMDLLSLPERSSAVIKGYVKMANSDEIPKNITIKVYDLKTNELIGEYRPNKNTGKYTIILRHGKEYKIKCEADNCKFKQDILVVPPNSSFFEINSPIILDPIGVIE
ncbi:MAG: hypothetical protein Kow0068_21140 [Marinilabiliales bacterium]